MFLLALFACVAPEGEGPVATVRLPGGTELGLDAFPSVDERPASVAAVRTAADLDGDGYSTDTDCNDRNANIHPGAAELCDGRDTDCDASTSEDGSVWLRTRTGRWVDLTSAFAAGTVSEAATLTIRTGTLNVCAGTWYAGLTIVGDARVIGRAGADATVLTGGGNYGGVYVAGPGVTAELSGLTLEGPTDNAVTYGTWYEEAGGVVACVASDESTVLISDSVIQNGVASGGEGGGIYLHGCGAELRDVVVRGNEARYGGGLFTWGSYEVRLIDSVVEGNVGSYGGGLGVSGDDGGSPLVLEDSVVRDNEADGGGGVAVWEGGTFVCQGSPSLLAGVLSNVATSSSSGGGGIYLHDNGLGSTVSATDCDMGRGATDNHPEDVYVWDTHAVYSAYTGNASFTCDVTGCS